MVTKPPPPGATSSGSTAWRRVLRSIVVLLPLSAVRLWQTVLCSVDHQALVASLNLLGRRVAVQGHQQRSAKELAESYVATISASGGRPHGDVSDDSPSNNLVGHHQRTTSASNAIGHNNTTIYQLPVRTSNNRPSRCSTSLYSSISSVYSNKQCLGGGCSIERGTICAMALSQLTTSSTTTTSTIRHPITTC
ncbi:hypothetical protein niasHT_035294 [Heterodera trifolii]|uniref:Uncharacterized protein n=1 Tax=Heterodera trifolii TaxID=157864 RepID=A0ABD2J2J4_9BILA